MADRIDYEQGILAMGNDCRIVNCMRKAMRGEPVTVAFLGGSITQGSLSSTPQLCYAYRTYKWWQDSFPKSEIRYVNAGIGGTTSHLGVGRVQEEVLSENPDFVIVEFSVNDEDESRHFQETYESLVRRLLAAPGKPALMLVHNVRYDDGGNAEAIHRPVGDHYGLPAVGMRPCVWSKIRDGELDKRSITPDDLHPNDLGHEMLSRLVTHYLEKVKLRAQEVERDLPDAFLPLPAPLTESTYEGAVRMRNDVLIPLENQGFQKDTSPQSCVADCFKKGWIASEKGARICFEVEGSNLAVQYRKTVRKPAPIAKAILDGDREHEVILDGNFEETWGDCLYLEVLMEHGAPGKHRIEIVIADADEQDAESFYLVSVICA